MSLKNKVFSIIIFGILVNLLEKQTAHEHNVWNKYLFIKKLVLDQHTELFVQLNVHVDDRIIA